MEFRILGPLEVSCESGTVALGGRTQRALLVLLLLNANRTVSVEQLINELWGGGGSVKSVQMAIARLRAALAAPVGGSPSVVTREHGYSLALGERETLDQLSFERGLEDGQRLLHERRLEQATACFATALDLWRGPALGEFAGDLWAVAEARRLEELRVLALEAQLEAALVRGDYVAAIPELERLARVYPDREGIRGRLMIALYHAGRQPDALQVFREARHHLVAEYGIEPGQELRALNEAILAQDVTRLAWHSDSEVERRGPGFTPALPLPARLRPYGPGRFVGRRRERRVLTEAMSSAVAGDRAAVVITGEPGVGKTRLVSEAASAAHAEGRLVLGGRCDEGLELAYQPFVEALEHLIEHAPLDLLRRHAADHGLAVARLVPLLARRLGEASTVTTAASESERYVLFAAIEALLAAAAKNQLMVVVLEDFHWADAPTLALLKYLLTSPRSAKVAIAVTIRSTELDEAHPVKQLLADLHREPRITRIDLAGLDVDEAQSLADVLAGHESEAGARALVARLHAATNGNPFFMTELLRGLAESGAISRASGRWEFTSSRDVLASLPASITETLDRRVGRLGADARDCLSAAATIGHEFDGDLLTAAIAMPGPRVADVVGHAVDSGLLVRGDEPDRRLRFAHALIDRWLYDQLNPPRRAQLHRRIALALEQRARAEHVDVVVLARHWSLAAGPTEIDKPLQYAVLAGDEALNRLAPEEARRWYQRAQELHVRRPDGTDAERCELLIKLGEAEQQCGAIGFRETLLEAARIARRTGDSDRLVRAALANTRGLQSSSGFVDEERIEVLDAAISAVGEKLTPNRARLLAIQAVELTFSGQWTRRLALSDDALALARELDDAATLATVLNLRFLTIWAPETHAERLANTAESVVACRRSGDPIALFHAFHWRVAASIEAADLTEARRCMALERTVADSLRQPTVLWLAACHDADLALIEGRLDEAERLALAALELGQASEPDAMACFAAQLSAIRYEQGRLGEIVDVLGQVVEANPGIPGFRAVLTRALCELERVDEAQRVIASAVTAGFRDVPYDVTWLTVACVYADSVCRLGDEAAARRLLSMLDPWGALIAYPGFGAEASVSHYLAELALSLGDVPRAELYHAEARRIHERIGDPIWIARSHYQAARLLHARGSHTAADEELVRALAAAEHLGLARLARQVREMLGEHVNGGASA